MKIIFFIFSLGGKRLVLYVCKVCTIVTPSAPFRGNTLIHVKTTWFEFKVVTAKFGCPKSK